VFTPIGTLIKNFPRRSKTPEAVLALQVRQAAKESLGEICRDLGSDVLDSAKIKSFKNGILVIQAPSLLCAELQMRSEGLIREINRVFAKRLVTHLRFRVG